MVAGSTGYIGKYVTKELIKRGYNVVAFAREKSGVGGKQSTEQTQKVCSFEWCLSCCCCYQSVPVGTACLSGSVLDITVKDKASICIMLHNDMYMTIT